jgi:hypothetical protein
MIHFADYGRGRMATKMNKIHLLMIWMVGNY